jgi:hypothetical protein
MKPQQILEFSCWDRIELSLGDPDKLFLRSGKQILGWRIGDRGDVADEEDRSNTAFPKRQKTAALQDASRISEQLRLRASFWTAAVFCRFSPRA